jgi:hypothetical protein
MGGWMSGRDWGCKGGDPGLLKIIEKSPVEFGTVELRLEPNRRKEARESLFDLSVGLSITSHFLAFYFQKLL